jgi:indole-3-glycerol phosphate synthase/phosphoribosylanthranilate isomerase
MKLDKTVPKYDILTQIVSQRKADIIEFGLAFGADIPLKRIRPVHPFLSKKGAILEIKRASPSKGDISLSLDAAQTAAEYVKSGAAAISVLTEKNFFKGSLNDLISAANAAGIAILRKDFLLSPEEIDISYRAGADAVLLIARILDSETLLAMAKRCESLGITAFIEVRLEEDIQKLSLVLSKVNHACIVCGVNARNLSDFSIDPLTPASMLQKIRLAADCKDGRESSSDANDIRVVYESGILTPEAAAFASCLGFTGMLLGEAASRDPEHASKLAEAFTSNTSTPNGEFWLSYAAELRRKSNIQTASFCRPFVKICGITRIEDALEAAKLGADFIGFIFSAQSKRSTTVQLVHQVYSALTFGKENGFKKPQLIGIITDPSSQEAASAFHLVREGVLDAIQFHGCTIPSPSDYLMRSVPRYAALRVGSDAELVLLDDLLLHGQPRVLVDAKVTGLAGGTGQRIDQRLVKKICTHTKLWLAGGITSDNVHEIISEFHPELIDVSSSIELAPGIKDIEKMKRLFKSLCVQ